MQIGQNSTEIFKFSSVEIVQAFCWDIQSFHRYFVEINQNWTILSSSKPLKKWAIMGHFEAALGAKVEKHQNEIADVRYLSFQCEMIQITLEELRLILTSSNKACSEDALVAKMGKVVNRVKIGHSESYLSLICWKDGKPAKPKLPILSSIQATLVAKFTIVGHFEPLWCEMIWKSWKTQNICWCMPPLPKEWKFLRFLQKWDTVVVKDGKSCESGEIGHSKSIWASFWGKRWKNLQNDQNWPFWANLSHFFWQNSPYQLRFCWDI